MSGTAFNEPFPSTASSVFKRFVWKEFRVLWGLWVALFCLCIFAQLSVRTFALPGSNQAGTMLGFALAAAVLYAIGGSAVVFSVEREEETHGFLAGLPTEWVPLFLGKTLFVAAGALTLAVLLSFCGWMLGGGKWPRPEEVGDLVGILGFGIVEAIAWGTLWSLLLKSPLRAAFATTLSITIVQFIVIVSQESEILFQAHHYVDALPLRLFAVTLLFAVNVLKARDWLFKGPPIKIRLAALARPRAAGTGLKDKQPLKWFRLIWQSWRESRGLFLLPLLAWFLACLLIGSGEALGRTYFGRNLYLAASPLLVLPALYGAFVFHIDQRRHSFRYFAERGIAAQMVWWVRQVIWLGALVFITTIIVLFLSVMMGTMFYGELVNQTLNQFSGPPLADQLHLTAANQMQVHTVISVFAVTCLATVTAYALGQGCSMLLRSELLACFVSILLAVALSYWLAVIIAWQLSGWWFLLPIAVGLLLATWLRAPDWVIERNTLRAWARPTLAVCVPLALIGLTLPVIRLWQIPSQLAATAENDIQASMSKLEAGDTPAARETAAMYLEAADIRVEPIEDDPLDRWQEKELKFYSVEEYRVRDQVATSYRYQNGVVTPNTIITRRGNTVIEKEVFERYQRDLRDKDENSDDENSEVDILFQDYLAEVLEEQRSDDSAGYRSSTLFAIFDAGGDSMAVEVSQIPVNDLPEFKKDWEKSAQLRRERAEVSDKVVMEASLRKECRFDFQGGFDSEQETKGVLSPSPTNNYEYKRLDKLLDDFEKSTSFARLLAALRMSYHLRDGQSTWIQLAEMFREGQIFERMVDWAAVEKTTVEEIQEATAELEAFFAEPRHPEYSLLVDSAGVRRVLLGKAEPLILAEKQVSQSQYVAYLANKLPWERERALEALDILTHLNLQSVRVLEKHLNSNLSGSLSTPVNDSVAAAFASIETSYLMAFEYNLSVPFVSFFNELVDTETRYRALLLRLALTAYAKDHGDYPVRLAEIVPDYLAEMQMDPHLGKEFHYNSARLDHLLPTNSNTAIAARTPHSLNGSAGWEPHQDSAFSGYDGESAGWERAEDYVYLMAPSGQAGHPSLIFSLNKLNAAEEFPGQ